MADDLEDFLRKAAERRAARQKSKPSGQASAPAPKTNSYEPPIILQPIDDPAPIASARSLGRLQPHIPPEHLAKEIDQADERLESHLKQAFDHPVSRLDQKAKKKKQTNKQAKPAVIVPTTPSVLNRSEADAANDYDYDASRTVSASNRSLIGSTNELVSMLRTPQTLKLAFIASEIFKPKFD